MVTMKCSLRLLRCEGGAFVLYSSMRHPDFNFDSDVCREYSRAVPTARSEVVTAVKPHMIDAINDMFSNMLNLLMLRSVSKES